MPLRRIAIVAAPAQEAGKSVGQGALDGDAISERLVQSDLGFEVHTLDGGRDIAEQLDELFDAHPADEAFFYASCHVSVSEGEFFLCFDAAEPEVGDGLADVVEVLADRVGEGILICLDGRCVLGKDSALPLSLVEVARRTVRASDAHVELLLGISEASDEASVSPFTRAVLAALDESMETGLSAADLREVLAESELVIGSVRTFSFVGSDPSFVLIEAPETRVDTTYESEDVELHAASTATPEPVVVAEADAGEAPAEPVEAPSKVDPAEDSPSPRVRQDDPPGDPDLIPPPVSSSPSQATELPKVAAKDPSPDSSSTETQQPPSPVLEPSVERSVPPPSGSQVDVSARGFLAEAEALFASRDFEEALQFYRKALGIGGLEKDDKASIYVRMGDAKAELGKPKEAILNFEKALALTPESTRIVRGLIDLYEAEGDFRAAANAQDRVLKSLNDDTSRLEALSEFARRWMAVPSEHARARQFLERAERIDGANTEVLEMLRVLAEQDGRAADVLSYRLRIAEATTDPQQKGGLLFALGSELVRRQGREEEGLKLLDGSLEVDPTRLEALALSAEVLSERQEWGELESVYRRMLTRLERFEDPVLRAKVETELCKRLGLVLREHLADDDEALLVFERGAEASHDLASYRLLAETAKAIGDLPRFQSSLLRLLSGAPRDASIYRELFQTFLRQDELERAAASAGALMVLGVSDDRARATVQAHKPTGLPTFESPLWPAAFRALLSFSADDHAAQVFEVIEDAAFDAWVDLLARRRLLVDLPRERVQAETSTVMAVRTLEWARRAIGLDDVRIVPDDKNLGAYSVCPAASPAVIVGQSALRGRGMVELSFLAGHCLSYWLPPFRLIALCSSLDDLNATFLGALRLVMPELPVPERLASLEGELRARLTLTLSDEARARLEVVARDFEAGSQRANVAAYVSQAERVALGIGALLASDVVTGAALARSVEPPHRSLSLLSAEERETAMMLASVSDELAEVRALMGLVSG